MPLGYSTLSSIAVLRDFRSARCSSFDRSGGNKDAVTIAPGGRHTLAEIDGPGCIKHFWSTNSLAHQREAMRSTIIRMWWDGESTPSVECPIVEFFGGAFGMCRNFWSLPLQMNPDSGRGMNCWFPMPFREHARIEVHNEWNEPLDLFYYVDHELYGAGTEARRHGATKGLTKGAAKMRASEERARMSHGAANGRRRGASGGAGSASAGGSARRTPISREPWSALESPEWVREQDWSRVAYFHCQWRRENPTAGWGRKDLKGPKNIENLKWYWKTPNRTGDENYTILEARGSGQYVGCHLDIDCYSREKNDWYGEGDDMIFIDGERWPPGLHGTGTEDYFCGAYCPRDAFNTPYVGITQYSGSPQWGEYEWPFRGKNSMYRFHIQDPIRFHESIRVTIEHGHNNKLSNDYSSTAYWYQLEPHAAFPKLPAAKLRLARPDWPDFVAPPGAAAGPPKRSRRR